MMKLVVTVVKEGTENDNRGGVVVVVQQWLGQDI